MVARHSPFSLVLRLFSILACLVAASLSTASEPSPLEIFDQRILPIFRSSNPSSCVQCHLSSVDLKNYILPSSEATFVSLRDQGLINFERPADSKILKLIRMGEKDLDAGAKMIHAKTRHAELEAFSAWVHACCVDPKFRELPRANDLARPEAPDAVIRHARKSRVVDSFVRNVWSQRMRCFPCHTPHEIDESNPRHQAAIKKQKEFAEQYGEEMLSRLHIFRETPEATLQYWIESSQSASGDRLPLIHLEQPANSLLVQKPMSRLPKKKEDGTFEAPSYHFPLSHMGGLKLHAHDQSYKSIVGWIQDYANVVAGRYQSVAELPEDNWYPSQLVVRVKTAPDAWNVGDVIQLFVHSWDEDNNAWEEEPVAFTQGTVTPKRMVNGALFLLGAEGRDFVGEGNKLPRGRYLVKAYLDSDHKVAEDPAMILSVKEYRGEAEIPKARWRAGFRFAEVVSGTDLKMQDLSSQ